MQPGLSGCAERLAGRTDGLVRLLGVLDLGGVDTRGVRQVVGAVQLADLGPCGRYRGTRQRRRVSPHVGDEAALVQPLGHLHGPGGAEAELAGRLLLHRRRPEGCVWPAGVRLGLDRTDLVRDVAQRSCERPGAALVQHDDVRGPRPQLAHRVEVAPLGDPGAGNRYQPGLERAGIVGGARLERGRQVPVVGRPECHALTFAVDHEPGGDALHPSSRQALHDLPPQDGRDLVAVEPVDDPPGLLGVDEVLVDVARAVDGGADRVAGDLVEDHPAHRHPRPQLFSQVPGDRLALAVLVGGEQEFVDVLERRLELAYLVLRPPRRHDVQRLEAAIDVDADRVAEPVALRRWHLGLLRRQVADVPERRLDDIAVAKVPGDRLRLGGRLDDDQAAQGAVVRSGQQGCSFSGGRG